MDVSEAMRKSSVMGWNLAFSAGACAASWAFVSPRFAGSVALGALLETVNFRGLWRSAEATFGRATPSASTALAAFGARFVLLAAVLWFALDRGVDPIGLVVGLSVIIPATVLAAWQARPRPGPVGVAPPPDDPSWEEWNAWLARERDADEEEES